MKMASCWRLLILAARADNFDARVLKLRTGAAGRPLTPATVLDDHAADVLIGAPGRNWRWRLSLDLLLLFGADDLLN